MEPVGEKSTENCGSKKENISAVDFKTPTLPTKSKRIERENVSTTKTDTINLESRATEEIKKEQIKDTQKLPSSIQPKSVSKLSPAEQLQQSRIAIPYKEPSWGGICEQEYKFEVIKNGAIIDNIKLDKTYIVFGRLPSCDVPMEHPSLSRHHAVVQFCKTPTEQQEKGWYLYDLDSTHGTWINKNKVYPKKYYRIRVGHVLKFGGSTRLHILQGPEEDKEEESDLSVEEMKQQREKQKREAEFLRQAELAEEERKIQELKAKEEARGCSWGMGEDAEEDEADNPFASIINTENEQLYIDDPKKALKGYFEREGYEEPEYNVQENGTGKFRCTVELPVDTPTGEPMVAEAIVSGKKKESVIQCALEACRMLDRMGLLRAATHESRKRKKKNWEEDDFYDSDDDTFLDRTGDIEKKRKQRMQKAGKMNDQVETYESLTEKLDNLQREIKDIEENLAKAKKETEAMQEEGMDALDAYMSAIKSGVMDTKTKMKLKRQLLELRKEAQKLQKLINVAKPAALPELKSNNVAVKARADKAHYTFGRLKKPLGNPKPKSPPKTPTENEDNIVEEEEEEEEISMEITDTHISSSVDTSTKTSGTEGQNRSNGTVEAESLTKTVKNVENIHKTSKSEETVTLLKGSAVPPTAAILKGPTMPPPELRGEDSIKGTVEENRKSEKQKKIKPLPKVKKQDVKLGSSYSSEDPDYAVWVPPENQSGDGKTFLNEKFGY
ncbi:kanadaptin-like [Saccostrea echinata]|uniref:kanadaptin-like n=1 Tax=Saccostrea echinata TaxID=191078 RepID=UPI002A83DE3B|nr:kanadaptin-like [Saccostrea echinata]